MPVIAIFCCATSTAAMAGVRDADATVGQVMDTLRDVLRSLEDDKQKVRDFQDSRQQWCQATLRNISGAMEEDANSVTALRVDLKENQVALEEVEGSVQQVEADIDLTMHTIKQTQDMQHVLLQMQQNQASKSPRDAHNLQAKTQYLNDMLEDKKKVLTSLQEERQVTLPVLAQLQAKVAEGQRLMSDQNESSTAVGSFVNALRDDCSGYSKHAEEEASASNSESQLVQKALQALAQVSSIPQPQGVSQVFSEQVQSTMEVSFLQQKASEGVTEAEVLDIFGGSPLDSDSDDSHSAHKALPPPEPATPRMHRQRATPLRISPKTLLAQWQAKAFGGQAEQHAWCEAERQNNAQDQQRAQAVASQLAAEVFENEHLEEQVASDLQRVQLSTSFFNALLSDVTNASAKAHSLLANRMKEQKIASKIIAQATAIIADIEQDPKARAKIVAPLTSAKDALNSQAKAAKKAQQQVIAATQFMVSKTHQVLKARQQQSLDLQLLHERHVSETMEARASQKSYEEEAAEAAAYVQKLMQVCSEGDRMQKVQEQRKVEVHALEDAQDVLDGKPVSTHSDTRGLRGVAASAPKKAMTPLERAAASIGVDMDDSES